MTARLSRTERQEQTRLRILDAALGVFRSRGFAGATIEEVAELAAITRGTVYLHFASKEGLLLSVLEQHLDAQVAAFRTAVVGAGTDEELVQLLVRSALSARSDRVVDGAALLAAVQSGDGTLAARAAAVQSQVDAAYAHLLERLCDLRGTSPLLTPAQLAVSVLALCNGLRARPLDDDPEVLVRAALDVLVPVGALR